MERHPSTDSGSSGALLPAIILFGGMTLILLALFAARPSPVTEPLAAAVPTVVAAEVTQPTTEPQVVAAAPDPAMVRAGDTIYQTTCAACHGFNAKGIPGLGKTLIDSEFVNGMTDEELVAFIIEGRQVTDPLNTTGVAMPARGGNAGLKDEDIHNVVAYIRNLNLASSGAVVAQPTAETVVDAASTPLPPVEFTPLDLGGLNAGGSAETPVEPEPVLDVNIGQKAYLASCASCHGSLGEGIQFVSRPLAESVLLQQRNGIGLLTFLTQASMVEGATASYPHPANGTPPAADDDMLSIIAYLYTLVAES
ncbi:MAG: c-type cytochrome [Anaerolineae bacterium]|nr:c-type cytochrome [Anaerolineae bacterium]